MYWYHYIGIGIRKTAFVCRPMKKVPYELWQYIKTKAFLWQIGTKYPYIFASNTIGCFTRWNPCHLLQFLLCFTGYHEDLVGFGPTNILKNKKIITSMIVRTNICTLVFSTCICTAYTRQTTTNEWLCLSSMLMASFSTEDVPKLGILEE